MEVQQFDAIVIGFGKAGKTLAGDLANKGQRVAMIEQSSGMYGGTCINIACIPSKKLVLEANKVKGRGLKNYKVKAKAYRQAIEKKRHLVKTLRDKNYHKLADDQHVTIFNGVGSFISDSMISVKNDEGEVKLTGDKIFINTGAIPKLPSIPGLENSKYAYDSTSMMEVQTLPRRLIIIGAGYIGLEFASMYANFGSKVIVLDPSPHFMAHEDEDIALSIRKVLEEKGVDFHLGANIEQIEDKDRGAVIHYSDKNGDHELMTEAVLVATGRTPNTEHLNLENTSIQKDEKGAVMVDEHLRTAAPNVYAVGDVKGGKQFTYISLDDYRIVMDDLQGGNKNKTIAEQAMVPYSVFIDPPFSRVGLSEEEAKEKGYSIKVATLQADNIPRAALDEEQEGILKAIVDERSGRILGCALFCAESPELINLLHLAMQTEQPYTVLKDQIFTHPTMSEALNDLFTMIH
ncbi:FAD-dependent oxidoreductase [Bacillus sp. 1P06AnD]|uniref:FAD-dependent oxidoreductase n=1 Tax=Bacillus sp. 1P06AnD TaxID=3132208 RepID=UPI0039A2F7D0